MIKLFVVDDEEMAVNYFRSLVSRIHLSEECRVTGYAMEGTEALNELEKSEPDIVFVDVSMPVMNGLELARRILAKNPAPYVVLLTSYRNFDYVREGMEMGVCSYLLKNELSVELLEAEISRIMKRKRQENQQKRAGLESCLRRFFLRGTPDEEWDWQQEFGGKKYILVYLTAKKIFCPSSENTVSPCGLDASLVREAADRISEDCPVIEYRDSFCILLEIDNRGQEAEEICQVLTGYLRAHENHCLGVYSETAEFFSLPVIWKQMQRLESCKYFWGERQTLSLGELMAHTFDHGQLLWDEAALKEALATGNRKAEDRIVGECFRLFEQTGSDERYIEGIRELLKLYSRFYKERGIANSREQENTALYSVSQIEEWIRGYIIQGHKFLIRNVKNAYSRMIAKSLQYIEEHYQENISVSEIADILHISDGHFRRTFKEEVGMSSGDYLTAYRIKKAKELLQRDNLKIVDIYKKVGFASSQYFSSTFKKMTGISPKDYRESLSRGSH